MCIRDSLIPLLSQMKFLTFKYLLNVFSNDFFVIPGFLSCTLLKRHSFVRRTDPLPLTSIAPPSNTNCFDLLLILTTGSIFFTLVNFDNLLLILLSFL